MLIGVLIRVSGDCGPVGAVSWPGFRDDGAFNSQRARGVSVASVWTVIVVESATPTDVDFRDGFGLKIGTKADFSTSISSSSDSSDSFISSEMFNLTEDDCGLWAADCGLDDDGDDVGVKGAFKFTGGD